MERRRVGGTAVKLGAHLDPLTALIFCTRCYILLRMRLEDIGKSYIPASYLALLDIRKEMRLQIIQLPCAITVARDV